MLAERCGARALYLSGSGVATASYGMPDLGVTSLRDVLDDVRRITAVTSLPLLVDVDTGWGSAFGIARTVRELVRAGAAGMHIEDQVSDKRCGHRPRKQIVPCAEMVDRVKAACAARDHWLLRCCSAGDAGAGGSDEAAVGGEEEGNTYYNRNTGGTSWDPPMMNNPMQSYFTCVDLATI